MWNLNNLRVRNSIQGCLAKSYGSNDIVCLIRTISAVEIEGSYLSLSIIIK